MEWNERRNLGREFEEGEGQRKTGGRRRNIIGRERRKSE